MRTKQAPWDYIKRLPITSQKIKLCDKCGSNMFWRDGDGYRCSSCRNTSYVIVYEHEAADFRLDLMEAQERFAAELAAEIKSLISEAEQIDALLALAERGEWDPFYLDEPTDAELRAIEAEDDGADDRPSTQMREHREF